VDWRELLLKAGIEEPPGRDAVLRDIAERPYNKPKKKKR